MFLSVSSNISPWSLCAVCLALLLAVAVTQTAHAQDSGDELEQEAQAIDKMIMCPVCPAETIDQAQVEISFQMRAVIREMLAEGRTREEILDYFVDRYGPDILAAPPKSGANLLAWVLPIVGVAAGLVGVYLVIRAMTGRQRPAPAAVPATPQGSSLAEAAEPGLAPYLEIADRLMAARRNLRPATSGPGEHAVSRPSTNEDATRPADSQQEDARPHG